MCGIFASLGVTLTKEQINKCIETIEPRGPDEQVFKQYEQEKVILGFTRLSINGLNNGNQPLEKHNCSLICNGEIYNYKQIYNENKWSASTDSDCEVILDLYNLYGFEAVNRLDGVFSFVLFDYDNKKIIVSRDPFGVRPLFWSVLSDGYVFASEMKTLVPICEEEKAPINQFQPGKISIFNMENNGWFIQSTIKYCHFSDVNHTTNTNELIIQQLYNAVEKRVLTTEQPIACLLSGGLDSSLITALVKHCIVKHNIQNGHLQTFSIGLKGGEDLKYAQIVAKHLDTQHHEVVISEEDFIQAIPEVINAIESYDTTTVRASVGNYLISKYIRENTSNKVVFNGDGSDEVTGGYLYFHYCDSSFSFDKECKRLLRDIHLFDVLRSDRSISSNGLEARTPFLDWNFVNSYMSIPSGKRWQPGKPEKYLLRNAFHQLWPELLPSSIIWRTKEAFSDGVSNNARSWYQIIKEHTRKMLFNPRKHWNYLKPKTKEQVWYRLIWEHHFNPLYETIIPYYWMPRFTEADDASARTLKVYSSNYINETLV